MPSTVPADIYSQAVVLAGTTMQCAILTGYAFGGGLITIVGARGSLAVNSATFLFSAVCLSGLRVGRDAPGGERSAGESLSAGIKFVLSDDIVRQTTILICFVSMGAIVSEVLAPAYAREVLHRGAGTAGALAAAVPLGTVVASIATHRVPGDVLCGDPHRAPRARVVDRIGRGVRPGPHDAVDRGSLRCGRRRLRLGARRQRRAGGEDSRPRPVFGVRAAPGGRDHRGGRGALVGGLLAQFAGVRLACFAGLLFVAAGAMATLVGLFSWSSER